MGKRNCSKNKKSKLELAKTRLTKEGYGIVGDHSAVKICLWTKHSIRGDRGCWKKKFYGISSAGCCQMTPSLFHCENKCLHCWRNLDYTSNKNIVNENDPIEILDGIVEARKKLLMGFKSREGIDMKKFEEAFEPKLYTMSLSGEATLYPRLGEMFKEIRRRGAISFLVTNGLNPSVLAGLSDLPTQLTISCTAPNEDLFYKFNRCSLKDGWERFCRSLDVMRELKGKVRRAVRLTLVEGENNLNENVDEYVSLIKKAEPDFVHIKGFKSVGYARKRFGYDKQVWFDGVKDYALKLLKGLEGYEVGGEDVRCCVVLLKKEGVEMRIGKV